MFYSRLSLNLFQTKNQHAYSVGMCIVTDYFGYILFRNMYFAQIFFYSPTSFAIHSQTTDNMILHTREPPKKRK